MKIFCDQCIGTDIFQTLKNAKLDVIHAASVMLSTATDDEIFHYAQKTKRILLTFDHDFGNILRFPIRNAYGVVIIYFTKMNKDQLSQRTLDTFIKFLKDNPPQHRLIIIDHNSTRIWPK